MHEPGPDRDPHRTAPAPPPSAPLDRILGVDLARALAIVGMLAVHVGPTRASDLPGRLYALPHGRASVLFVLVAGIGVSILASSRRTAPADAARTLAWRAAVLMPAGLALQELDHRVFVILQTYGLLFLLAILAVRLPDRVLLMATVVLGIAGPLVYLVGVLTDPGTFDRTAVRLGDGPRVLAHRLLLSGPYPVVVWAAPFLLGTWIGRRDLRARRVRWGLMLWGGIAVLATYGAVPALAAAFAPEELSGPWLFLSNAPHSQMPLWLLGSAGSGALVVGACLWSGDRWPRAAWPLAAMGQLALTLYVGHLLALHAWSDVLRSDDVGRASVVVLAATAVGAATSVAWRAVLPRGPLEALSRAPTRRR